MYDKVYKIQKRIEFLDAVIKEKTEEISKTEDELAFYRKKNGRALKTDIDIKIYELNMKLSAEKKSVASGKAEKKRLIGEAEEILRIELATEAAYSEKRKIKELFLSLTGGKEMLTDENDDYRPTLIRVTKDKHKNGNFSRLLKAGVTTAAGRVKYYPEAEIFAYSEDREEGETYEENSDLVVTPKKKAINHNIEKKKKNKHRRARRSLPTKKILALFAFVVAVALTCLWAYSLKIPERAAEGRYVLYSILFVISLFAVSLSAYRSGGRKFFVKYLPISAVVSGLEIIAFNFIYAVPLEMFLFPGLLVFYGLAFAFLKAKEERKELPSVFFALFAALGAAAGAAISGIYGRLSTADEKTFIWSITLVGGIVALVLCLYRIVNPKLKSEKSEAGVFFAAAFSLVFAIMIPEITLSVLLYLLCGICFLTEVLR